MKSYGHCGLDIGDALAREREVTADIVIAGVGMVPFRKPGQSEPYDLMGAQAARAVAPHCGV